jgi:hypothetical protein
VPNPISAKPITPIMICPIKFLMPNTNVLTLISPATDITNMVAPKIMINIDERFNNACDISDINYSPNFKRLTLSVSALTKREKQLPTQNP